MFSLIKQMFLILLSFLSLNDEPFMVRPILIDLNPVELKYYSFIICLDKCNRSCIVLSPIIPYLI